MKIKEYITQFYFLIEIELRIKDKIVIHDDFFILNPDR